MNIKLYAIKTIRSTKKSKDTFLKILRNYIYILRYSNENKDMEYGLSLTHNRSTMS